jgi:hypothetical protein
LLALVNVTLVTFFFLTRMHERYTFPAFIPLIILSLSEKSYFKYLLILTFTHLLNVYNLWWFPRLPFLIKALQLGVIIRLISLTNFYLLFALLKSQLRSHASQT